MEASPPHGEPSPEAPPPSLDCLPSDILDAVVSRLPVRDAVRTSALSRDWRRRWETAPGIRFILSGSDEEPPNAQAAIDAFLARYACPVRHFDYANIHIHAEPHADQVLARLAGRGVEYLSFKFARHNYAEEFHTLHPAVFSCNALTHLFLDRCNLPPAPSSFSGFPNLTSLQLSDVCLPEHGDRDLEAMIQMSPLLTKLLLRYVWNPAVEVGGEWVIRAPNLQSLSIEAIDDCSWQIEELPSLQQAYIEVKFFDTSCDFIRLFAHLKQVTKLEFHMPQTEVNALDGLSCRFQKLKEDTLHTNLCSRSNILSTFSVLKCAPNLEDLKIMPVNDQAQEDEVDMNFFNALWINGLFANLTHVTMINTPLGSNEMHFTEFVLSKARQLRSFYIYQDCRSPYSMPREVVVIKLNEIRRVSPKAKVVIKSAEEWWKTMA